MFRFTYVSTLAVLLVSSIGSSCGKGFRPLEPLAPLGSSLCCGQILGVVKIEKKAVVPT